MFNFGTVLYINSFIWGKLFDVFGCLGSLCEYPQKTSPATMKIDRTILLRRRYWGEITRMRTEIAAMERKLALLDEIDKEKIGIKRKRGQSRKRFY